MTEILTESFCERCGTRYTFESARPKLRLKGVKVVSRGLKNFVLSDSTSMDEAMAAARSETEREVTSYQLDAFHKTFNFCMQCRQYTCPNCWNEAEARCLTCAPHLGHDVLPAPFPDLPANGFPALGASIGGGATLVNGANGANGTHPGELLELAPPAMVEPSPPDMFELAPPEADVDVVQPDADFDVSARLDALTMIGGPVADPVVDIPMFEVPAVGAAIPVDAVVEVTELAAEPVAAEPVAAEPVAAEPETVDAVEPSVVAEEHDSATIAALGAAALLIGGQATDHEAPSEAQPQERFSRFMPGQDLDAELDAYERQQAAAAAAAAPGAAVVADPTTTVAATGSAGTAEATGEPEAIGATVVETHAAPEPAIVAEPEISAAPQVAEAAEPQVAEPQVAEPQVAEAAPVDVSPAPEPTIAATPEIVETAPVDAQPEHAPAAAADLVVGAATAAEAEADVAAAPQVEAAVDTAPDVDRAPAVEAVALAAVAASEPEIVEPEAVEPVAAVAVPEPVIAAPEPVAAEPAPEPIAAAVETEAAPIAATAETDEPETPPVADDVVAQPTWQVVAPAAIAATPPAPESPTPPAADPAAEPQWPTRPAWLGSAPSVGLPFLGRPNQPQGGLDALWAESNREVANPPSTAKPAGVQPCVSCGLSLSATARFCRRCGTAQTG